MVKAEVLRSSIRSLVERPLTEKDPLTDKDLFVSPDSFVLTELGRRTQRLYSVETYLCAVSGKDPSVNGNPTPAKLEELEREVEEGCTQLGIMRDKLSVAREQMLGVLEAKEQRLREKYPLLESVSATREI